MDGLKLLVSALIICQFALSAACVTKETPVTETYYVTDTKTEYKTETYTETESVVVKTITGGVKLKPDTKWHNQIWWLEGFGSSGSAFYYGYNIDDRTYLYDSLGYPFSKHSSNQVKITISWLAKEQRGVIVVYDLSEIGQIPPMDITPSQTLYGGQPLIYLEWLKHLQTSMIDTTVLAKLDTGPGTVGDEIVFDATGVRSFAIIANTYIYDAITDVELTWADDIIEEKTVTKERQVPYEVTYQVEKQRTVVTTEQIPFWEAFLSK